MIAKLVAEEGALKGLTLSFQEGEQWIIGRDPDACQLLIEDPAVSRKHLLCRATPEGITIQNLSETNPVLINDQSLEDIHLLHDGDVIKIGNGVFRFFINATPPEEKQAPPQTELQDGDKPPAEGAVLEQGLPPPADAQPAPSEFPSLDTEKLVHHPEQKKRKSTLPFTRKKLLFLKNRRKSPKSISISWKPADGSSK